MKESKFVVVVLKTGMHREKRSHIRVTKSGTIWFTKSLCEDLNFAGGMMIDFVQYRDDPKSWFLKRMGQLKLSLKGKTGSFSVGSADLYQKIIESLGLEKGKNYSFAVSPEPESENGENYYPIITKNPF